ncbi:MAG: hypothetical protein WAU01_10870, partial [Saprospiraceae bacterium]
FVIEPASRTLPREDQDVIEADRLLDVLEKEVLPTYYKHPKTWAKIVKNGMRDVSPAFESGRMAKEYYTRLFDIEVPVHQMK